MPRKVLLVLAVLAAAGAVLFWWRMGTFNPPGAVAEEGEWTELLRERIKVPAGYRFGVFAAGLDGPRLMQLTPDGDLIVSGYRHGTVLLVKRDGDGDGASDGTRVLLRGLDNPHGLLLEGNTLYVAEETRVTKYGFDGAALSGGAAILTGVPPGGAHVSRTLKRGPDGFLYLATGSTCNSCIENYPWHAAIIRFKEGEPAELFASGLRNTVGFDWRPGTAALYGVDNGRDGMGDDVPDDEVNLIEPGHHYGWPHVHGFDVGDPGLHARMPAGLVVTPPAHGLGAHVAPLSILFLRHQGDAAMNGSALVAEHGSWNRTVKSGYRIVRLIFNGGGIREEPFLMGCEKDDDVICRPVDMVESPDGSLYVSDDYAGAIYLIAKNP